VRELEKDLRAALGREQPSDGFAARVLARVDAPRPRYARWIGAAIAACLLLSAGRFEYQQYQGRRARQELLFALGVAGNKLSIAQQKVFDLNRRTIHD